jgi:hypothetical protein
MKSTRHKPKGVSAEDLAADHAMRKAIRSALRENYPEFPRPSGVDWLVAPAPAQCPDCDEWLFLVRVPGCEFVQLAYCLDCDEAFEMLLLQ